jgi:hypothetical protein
MDGEMMVVAGASIRSVKEVDAEIKKRIFMQSVDRMPNKARRMSGMPEEIILISGM